MCVCALFAAEVMLLFEAWFVAVCLIFVAERVCTKFLLFERNKAVVIAVLMSIM